MEELLKRNTDCVYFLASPLTCKKGAECEYRHNEMARLNPRDCWYWLSGCCVNPTCAFRHPPIEVHPEAPFEAPSFQHHPSTTRIKNDVPCYFFYGGYCIKGENCTFLHGFPDDVTAQKPKMESIVTEAPPLKTKPVSRTGTEPASMDKCLVLSDTVQKAGADLQLQRKLPSRDPATNNTSNSPLERRAYPNVMGCSENKRNKAAESNSMEHGDRVAGSEPSVYADESSEEQGDGNPERESSPGFDVLADERSEDVVYEYEEDPECLQSLDGDHGRLHLEHRYGKQICYDGRNLLGNDKRESDDYIGNEDVFALDVYSSKDVRVGYDMFRKRRFLAAESPVRGCSDVDLRDHLRKRRMCDNYLGRIAFRQHEYSNVSDRLGRYDSSRRLRGRLASKVGTDDAGLPFWNSARATGKQRGWPRNMQIDRTRNRVEMKRRPVSARNPHIRRKRQADEENDVFTGPKTLAEIKEEKHRDTVVYVDFDGSKPLCVHKEKRRDGSDGNGDSNCSF